MPIFWKFQVHSVQMVMHSPHTIKYLILERISKPSFRLNNFHHLRHSGNVTKKYVVLKIRQKNWSCSLIIQIAQERSHAIIKSRLSTELLNRSLKNKNACCWSWPQVPVKLIQHFKSSGGSGKPGLSSVSSF